MAEIYRFFDSIDGEDERFYTADEFAEYFRQFIRNGVFKGDDNLEVTSYENDMKISIKAGYAWIEGYLYKIEGEDLILEHSIADPSLNRIDRVVIRLDKTLENRYVKTFILKGAPEETPKAPELTRNDNIYELSLAQVEIIAGKSFIKSDQIRDERFDKSVCGITNHLCEQDITHLVTKIQLNQHKEYAATENGLGHVKAGVNVTIDEDGRINAKGDVDSVNGKAGKVKIDVVDIGAVPISRKVNKKELSNNIEIDVFDIPGLCARKTIIGEDATGEEFSIVMGYSSYARNGFCVTIGNGAISEGGANSVSLGAFSKTGARNAVSIGYMSEALNTQEGVLGSNYSQHTNKWLVPGALTVKGTKNFEISHPNPEKKATHVIRHGAVESPTAGDTLYRYKVQANKDDDLIAIDLPDYFIWLNKNVQVFVTPQGHFLNAYGELNREAEQVEIYCQGEGEYNVLIIGTRNDDHQSVVDWDIKGVERQIGESWTGETYIFELDEIIEIEEIKEVV